MGADLKDFEDEQIDAEMLNSLAVTIDNFRYRMKGNFSRSQNRRRRYVPMKDTNLFCIFYFQMRRVFF
jgi:hypothetical protein